MEKSLPDKEELKKQLEQLKAAEEKDREHGAMCYCPADRGGAERKGCLGFLFALFLKLICKEE